MVFPALTWVLLVVAAVISAVGFYKFIWFLSVGYGLSVAGIGIAILVISLIRGDMTVVLAVLCVLLIVYGIRLGGFLLVRELKSAAYKKTLESQTEKPVPMPVKIAIWICVAVLYVMQTSPVWYREATAPMGGQITAWIGAVLMVIGMILEATADKQKSASKKTDPHKPAMNGLYRLCRCPNYFGEIVFWTGVFVSGWGILKGWQWLIAALGYVCIFYIMVNGAQRLEKRQNKNYGEMEEYRKYVAKTPILIPFVPIYHLVKEEKGDK